MLLQDIDHFLQLQGRCGQQGVRGSFGRSPRFTVRSVKTIRNHDSMNRLTMQVVTIPHATMIPKEISKIFTLWCIVGREPSNVTYLEAISITPKSLELYTYKFSRYDLPEA